MHIADRLLAALDRLSPAGHGMRALRPALRGLRPGAGADRSRVGEELHDEVQRLERRRLQDPGDLHKRRASRPREAPPLGAVDRLLQAGASRSPPQPARPVLEGHQDRRRGEEEQRPGRRRPSSRLDQGDRHDLLGDQESLIPKRLRRTTSCAMVAYRVARCS